MTKRARVPGLIAASLAVPAVLFAASVALAAVPSTLTEQGRVFDAAGAPLAGTVPIRFAVYASPTGGAPLWSETQTLTLDEGYFSAQIGTVTAMPPALWDGSTRYVGVQVGTDPEMSPRQATASVPYALVAGDATGDIHPTTITVDGQLVIDANGNWVGPATGLVGPTGPAGPQGTAGATGPQGLQGAVGPTGPQGLQGTAGAAGPAGAVGPTGPQGAQGAQGAVGPTGPQGSQGVAGPAGPAGPQGTAGPQGPQGAQGVQGPTGATGPQGPAGGGGGGGACYVHWGNASCAAGYEAVMTGRPGGLESFEGGGGTMNNAQCVSGAAPAMQSWGSPYNNRMMRANAAGSGMDNTDNSCAICCTGGCYTALGTTSCAAGYTAKYTGRAGGVEAYNSEQIYGQTMCIDGGATTDFTWPSGYSTRLMRHRPTVAGGGANGMDQIDSSCAVCCSN